MPYVEKMGLASEWPERLLDSCFQVLLVILDFHPKIKTSEEKEEEKNEETHVVGYVNEGINVLSAIKSPNECKFIFNGLQKLLNSIHMSNSTYLPSSMKSVSCTQEMLMFLWRIFDCNDDFTSHCFKEEKFSLMVAPLLYLMYVGRDKLSQGGVIQICSFIFLKLSAQRNFGISMNVPFDISLPIDLPSFKGNYGDFLCLTLHKLIVSGNADLKPLHK